MTPEQKAKRAELERIKKENNRPGNYEKARAEFSDMEDTKYPGMWKDAYTDFTTEEQDDVNEIEDEREAMGLPRREYVANKYGLVPMEPQPTPKPEIDVEDEELPTTSELEKKHEQSFRDLLMENRKKPIKLSR